MTDQEKDALIAELMSRLAKKDLVEHNKNILKPTLDKWCMDDNGDVYNSRMRKAFDGDGIAESQTWECIRKMTCKIMGVSYIRQINDAEKANHVADRLCKTVCELCEEVRHDKEVQEKDIRG